MRRGERKIKCLFWLTILEIPVDEAMWPPCWACFQAVYYIRSTWRSRIAHLVAKNQNNAARTTLGSNPLWPRDLPTLDSFLKLLHPYPVLTREESSLEHTGRLLPVSTGFSAGSQPWHCHTYKNEWQFLVSADASSSLTVFLFPWGLLNFLHLLQSLGPLLISITLFFLLTMHSLKSRSTAL